MNRFRFAALAAGFALSASGALVVAEGATASSSSTSAPTSPSTSNSSTSPVGVIDIGTPLGPITGHRGSASPGHQNAPVTAERPRPSRRPHRTSAHKHSSPASIRDGVVLVGFQRSVTAQGQRAIAARAGAPSVGRPAAREIRILHVPRGGVFRAIRLLRHRPGVRFAEPDYLMHESAVPNDPSFGLQWGFQNLGQIVNGSAGTPGADENAVKAWNLTTGSPSVVIGEADSGLDYNHPDLAPNVWSNPGGIGGCPGGTHGYNVQAGTCDPMDDETTYGGHGTHVAGILGARGNNGIGVTGVNWQTTILPVKWLNSSGNGYTDQLISALQWLLQAKQAGANIRVVNDSATFVGTAYSQALSDEIDTLGNNNILFVTAAGNTGDNNDNLAVRRYPCGYDRPTEICVTASDQTDHLPTWANYGPHTVDLAAPGVNIYSTKRSGSCSNPPCYGYISGGSMASPQVAGTAALILSHQDMSPTALKADILNNVDPLPQLSGLVITGGRLDVCKALPGCATQVTPPANTAVPTISGTPQVGQTLTASPGTWSGSPTAYAYQWQSCDSAGSSCVAISGATQSTYTLASADAGFTIRVSVTASNSGGSSSATSSQTGVVQSAPPPPSSTSTFGKTSVGASSDTMSADRKRVNQYTISSAATVTKLTMYLAPTGTSGTQNLRGIIYADSGGVPGALVAASNQVTFSSSNAAGWYDLVLPSPVTLSAGSYWIGVISGATGGVTGFRYDWVSGARVYDSNTYTSGPSNPFGSGSTDGEQMSVYATYTPASSTPPPPPANTASPTISGTPQVGSTLTALAGTWSNSPTAYAYQWDRCGSASCAAIAGATASSYTAVSADAGSTLAVAVTASNAGGSTTATSAPTAVVAQAPSPGPTTGTLGKTTIGASSDTMAANRKRVNQYTLSAAASMSKLTIYLAPTGTSGTQALRGIIYADSSGTPGALLATSNELVFSSTQSAGWYDLPLPSPVSLAAGKYWIGMISGASSGVASFRWDSVASSRVYNSNTYTSGPSNPFGPIGGTDSEQMSIYATYTTG